MRKLMMIAASTVALTVAGAGLAAAQDNAAPARPLTPDSPGAGAIKKDETMKNDPAMEQRRTTVPVPDTSRSPDAAAYRSYKDNKEALGGATIAGGLSADALLGADIVNPNGDAIGEVEDLVIGTNGRVDMAIVEVGGFLGIGSKTVAVNLSELEQAPNGKAFVTPLTKDELKTLSEYKKQDGVWVLSGK